MTAIEKHLHEHFASLQDTDDAPVYLPSRGAGMLGDCIPDTLDEAFAKVNTVVAGSPADSAGLQPGDEIRNFGYVNKGNHDGLKKVAECVQGNQGVSIWCCPHAGTRSRRTRLTDKAAKHCRQDITTRRGEPETRIATDPYASPELGRSWHVGLPHPAYIVRQAVPVSFIAWGLPVHLSRGRLPSPASWADNKPTQFGLCMYGVCVRVRTCVGGWVCHKARCRHRE